MTINEKQVYEVLKRIGVPFANNGYDYLKRAVLLTSDDVSSLRSITTKLYPAIAKEFGTTSSRVERAIRHASDIAWDRGNLDTLNSFFGYTVNTCKGKPTNSEFIALKTDKLRLQYKPA